MVLPARDIEYPAGITSILEAMALGKAVVATRSRGICEYILEGKTGLWADLVDPEDLRKRILYLWNQAEIAEQMGVAARDWATERPDMARYASELAAIVRRAAEMPSCV